MNEPRLGTKQDLVDLVAECHANNIRVILDVVFNHSGNNWIYGNGENLPAYQNHPGQLDFGKWRDGKGQPNLAAPVSPDDGVWPIEFQDGAVYAPLVDGSRGASVDVASPGFGPFGTSGFHCFDETNPTFVRAAHLLAVRQQKPALRSGRQSQRPLGQFGWANLDYPSGEIIAWSRILDDREFLVIVNGNGIARRSADILVDFNLNPNGSSMSVIANTAERATAARGGIYRGLYPVGSLVVVNRPVGGPAFVTITDLDPSEVLVLGSVGA